MDPSDGRGNPKNSPTKSQRQSPSSATAPHMTIPQRPTISQMPFGPRTSKITTPLATAGTLIDGPLVVGHPYAVDDPRATSIVEDDENFDGRLMQGSRSNGRVLLSRFPPSNRPVAPPPVMAPRGAHNYKRGILRGHTCVFTTPGSPVGSI